MPDFVVTTAFRGRDELQATFKKMGKGADMFGRKASGAFLKASNQALSFKKIVGGVLTAGMVQRGIGLLEQGVTKVVTSFLDFDDAITAASAKFGEFDKNSKTFKDLVATAREVGETTEYTSAQAAEGLRFLAKAGWEPVTAMKSLRSFVDLATASEMEFARAADIATDVMGAFGLQSANAEQNIKNLTRVNDVMSKAVNMSNIDLEDIFETIKDAGPIAKTAGISIEKFGAMTAFIGGAGIKAGTGGTALKNMIVNLVAPTPKAIKQMKKLGLVVQDAAGNMRDPIVLLKELAKSMSKMGTAQQAAATKILFGKLAIAGASVSISDATGKMNEFEQALIDSGGNAEKLAEFMRTSMTKRLAGLESALIGVGFKFIDAFAGKAPEGVDAATEAIRNFDVQPVVDKIKEIGNTIRTTLQSTRQFIEDYKGLFVGLGVAVAAIKFAPLVLGIMKFAAAAKVAGGAMAALNVIIAANPIGLMVISLGAAAAGIYTLITRWDELKNAVKWAADDINGYLDGIRQHPFIKYNPFKAIPREIKNNWGSIKQFFSDLFGTIVNIVSAAGGTILEILTHPLDLVKTLWSGIKKVGNYMGIGGGQEAGKTTPPMMTRETKGANSQQQSALPPSRTEVESKQAISFNGAITLANAPQGSKFEGKTRGAPPIRTEMLGVNP